MSPFLELVGELSVGAGLECDMRSRFLSLVCAIVLVSGARALADPAVDGAAALAELAAARNLYLVSRPGSRPAFGLTWNIPRDATGALRAQIVVESGPSGVAALVQENELAYAYVTDGLFVMLDSQNPGRLLVTERMQLEFDVGVIAGGKRLHFAFNCGPLKDGGWVDVDFPSLLRALAEQGDDVIEYDPRAGKIRIPLPNMTFTVYRAVAPDARFPIERFTMELQRTGLHTLADIWVGPREGRSILGLSAAHLGPLKAQREELEKSDVPSQLPLPPRDFWTVPANRAAGEELAALVASLSRARRDPTTRAADPPAQANAAPPAQQVQEPARPRRFDPQRAEVKLMFDGLWRILAGLNLSPQQTAEVKAALAVGQARFDEIIGQLEQRDADAETVHRAIVAAGERLIENLREPLTDAQDSRFGAAWLVFINEDADRASAYNLLGVIAAGVLELDLPDKQRREAVEPLWDAWRRMERLRGQVQAGELRQAEAVRRVLEVTNALMGQLERVLGPDLYRKLDEYVRRHADPRLLRPRSD